VGKNEAEYHHPDLSANLNRTTPLVILPSLPISDSVRISTPTKDPHFPLHACVHIAYQNICPSILGQKVSPKSIFRLCFQKYLDNTGFTSQPHPLIPPLYSTNIPASPISLLHSTLHPCPSPISHSHPASVHPSLPIRTANTASPSPQSESSDRQGSTPTQETRVLRDAGEPRRKAPCTAA
jgi:hypothetical protein